jgi:hypothetical protein
MPNISRSVNNQLGKIKNRPFAVHKKNYACYWRIYIYCMIKINKSVVELETFLRHQLIHFWRFHCSLKQILTNTVQIREDGRPQR